MRRVRRSALPLIALAAALGFVGELALAAPPGLSSAEVRPKQEPAREASVAPVRRDSARATRTRRATRAGRATRAAGSRRRTSAVQRNRRIARRMLDRQRWSSSRQFRCLDRLWTSESHWNHRAAEPTTGAYGIPQAHPGAKMASAGRDWRSNPRTQIRWGLRYVRGRHGGACAAWDHFRSLGWY